MNEMKPYYEMLSTNINTKLPLKSFDSRRLNWHTYNDVATP